MQKITRTEIRWIISELEETIREMEDLIANTDNEDLKYVCTTRKEGYGTLADKLAKTLAKEDKRVEIVQW